MTDRLEPADPLCFSDVATVVLAKLPDGKVKSPPLFFGRGDPHPGEATGRQGQITPSVFRTWQRWSWRSRRTAMSKSPRISLPEEKALQRDEVLEVPFLDGRIRLAPKGPLSGRLAIRPVPAYDPCGPWPETGH